MRLYTPSGANSATSASTRSPQTVARLLKTMGYSLRVNHKKLAGASHPNRNRQFRLITELRERCAADNRDVRITPNSVRPKAVRTEPG